MSVYLIHNNGDAMHTYIYQNQNKWREKMSRHPAVVHEATLWAQQIH
jgi:hypothetical protein